MLLRYRDQDYEVQCHCLGQELSGPALEFQSWLQLRAGENGCINYRGQSRQRAHYITPPVSHICYSDPSSDEKEVVNTGLARGLPFLAAKEQL